MEDNKTRKEYLNELVPFTPFKDDGRYKYPIFVGVNGRTWLIPRGVQSMIPRYVYNFIQANMRQEIEAIMQMERLSREFEQDSRRY